MISCRLRRAFSAAILVGAAILAAFCAAAPQAIVPTPAVPPLAEVFRVAFPGEAVRSLFSWHGRVVLATRGGEVRALDTSSRTFVWAWQGAGSCVVPPAVSEAALVVLNGSNVLTCLDREGQKRWTVETAEPVLSGPVIVGDKVVVATHAGELIGLDAESAAEKWRIPGEGDVPVALGCWWEHLIVVSSKGRIQMIDEDGLRKGEFDAGEGEALAGCLFIDGDMALISRAGAKIVATALRTKQRDWIMNVGGTLASEGLRFGKNLFVPTDNGALFSLRRESGEIQWWQALPSRTAFRPVLWNGRVLQAVPSLTLASFDPETGQPAVVATLAAEIRTAPLPLDGGLYIAVYDGDSGRGFLIFLKENAIS